MNQTQKIKKVNVLREEFLEPEERFVLEYLEGFNRRANKRFGEEEFQEFVWEYDF